jgi:hypothetical protein
MDVSSRTGLVDSWVPADNRRTDIACHAGLVDAGVAMNVTGGTRLVDPGITCGGRHRKRGERRAKKQCGEKPTPETARSSCCPVAIKGGHHHLLRLFTDYPLNVFNHCTLPVVGQRASQMHQGCADT